MVIDLSGSQHMAAQYLPVNSELMSDIEQTAVPHGCEIFRGAHSLKPAITEGDMGTAVHPRIKDAVFEPEATHALAVAFDDICREMNLPLTAADAREIVATRVIDLAREGVIDPSVLRERVLREARQLRTAL
jgi:hypothetical protein